jgi:hypothetical protein
MMRIEVPSQNLVRKNAFRGYSVIEDVSTILISVAKQKV